MTWDALTRRNYLREYRRLKRGWSLELAEDLPSERFHLWTVGEQFAWLRERRRERLRRQA